MSIHVCAKVAPAGLARFWVGVFGHSRRPSLRFEASGEVVAPRIVRPLAAFRSGELQGDAAEARAFTGVFELAVPAGSPRLALSVHAAADARDSRAEEHAVVELPSLPAQVPTAPGHTLNVLLTSCYYHKGDHARAIAEVLRDLPASARPDLVLFLGDQVYLDLPTLADFESDAAWLARAFERRYASVWQGPYSSALELAPSACVPDDHEYWNNYPHPSPFIQNSWSATGRDLWEKAACAAFAAFQLGGAGQVGDPIRFDVPPLSFFLADTRSARTRDRRRTLAPSALTELRDWGAHVLSQQLYPVFVAGQSLLDAPAGASGAIADYALSDYGDYSSIMAALDQIAQAGRCPVLVTGDVHYGRVVQAVDAFTGRPRAVEVISSPASLVDNVITDWLADLVRGGTWPKHSPGADPPPRVSAGQSVWSARSLHKQRGDHVTLLSFRRHGHGLQLRASFWPVHSRGALRTPTRLDWIDLLSPE